MIDYGAAAADMVAATTICGKYFIEHNNMEIKQSLFNIQRDLSVVCTHSCWGYRECVGNLDLRVQVHPGELWVSNAGAHRTRSLKSSGCKR